MADTIEKNLSIQVRLSLIFLYYTGQICIGFEADTRKNDSNMPKVWDFQTKFCLKSYCRATEQFGCSSITF